jgi:hypothetical protein
MPLKRGSSQKTVSENISELHDGKQYAKTKAKHGKATANRQAIAIALGNTGKSGKRPRTIAEGY